MFQKNIFYFLLSFSLSMVACVPLKYLVLDNLVDQDLATNLLFLGFGIFFVLFERLFNFRKRAKFRYNIYPINLNFLLFTILIVWIMETLFIMPINRFFFPISGFGLKPYFILSSIIIAPFFEELMFRSILLQSLLTKYSQRKSILISACLFGLIHVQPVQIIFATITGIIFGIVYAKSKNVTYTIILHSFTNAIVILIKFLNYKFSGLILNSTIIGINIIISSLLLYYMNKKYGFSIIKLIQEVNKGAKK
ncbi:CPBP family intramembrane glutamic endopeptidase [Flavobacterium branchiicola]|uniref:CPBP family intramembrane glutamic endopeptidase n=1 Tax=Flavobacterium branchiicola TaxID=1114875 RepID=A0ABV9PBT1_9FLAO|nr:CPBP family intramembrane glutamic endopeptidase [Flavobacterium branchiicola]MBS7254032.1 CPBP family intramembrane metalloprotease [Flavobacterium branchiicola]